MLGIYRMKYRAFDNSSFKLAKVSQYRLPFSLRLPLLFFVFSDNIEHRLHLNYYVEKVETIQYV